MRQSRNRENPSKIVGKMLHIVVLFCLMLSGFDSSGLTLPVVQARQAMASSKADVAAGRGVSEDSTRDEKEPWDVRPPAPSNYCNNVSQGVKLGPNNPPTPFLYQPFAETQSFTSIWNSQMDHASPDYVEDGVVATLGEKLQYQRYTPSYPGDFREFLKAGTYGWDSLGNLKFFEHTIDPTTRDKKWILYYQSPFLSEQYGDSTHAYIGYDGHDGHDFGVVGDALAAAAGTVAWAGDTGGKLGQVVEIYHPEGYLTRYAHLDSTSVKKGDPVSINQKIGVIGGTGGWAVHLHFSVYRWNEALKQWQVTDPFGWDPWQGTVGQDADPLVNCNGEVSYNLWFGWWPQPYSGVSNESVNQGGRDPRQNLVNVLSSRERPSQDRYIGGFLGDDSSRGSVLDQATFISDVTLPDGAVVTPAASLIKTWRVKNSGSSTWNGYKLIFVSGDQMSAPSPVDVPYAAPGDVIDISISIQAPTASARGNWRIVNPSGTWVRYGNLWVELTVEGTNPVDSADVELDCLDCPAVVAPGQTFRPTIRATVNSGQLLGVNLRGDMLRHKSGERFDAYEFIAVEDNDVVNPGQTYDFTFYENDPLTAPTTEGDYETTWQIWRDGNWAGEEYTIRFKVRQGGMLNHPPNRPTLTGPGDWAVYQGNTGITLEAQHNGDPDGDPVTEYYFEIFESAQNANSGWTTSNSWSPQGLGNYNYQWRVKVRDSGGNESDWSEVWHFGIEDSSVVIDYFYARQCGDLADDPDKICFCANANQGELRLQINLATDGSENGEWKIIGYTGREMHCTTQYNTINLDHLDYESGQHLVRLYARTDGGWEAAATADTFVDMPPERPPNRPAGRQPLDHAYVNSKTVHFDWRDTFRTTSYRLEVSTDPGYGTLLIDESFSVGTSEYDYVLGSDYETIYWRVTSTGPYGTSDAAQSFHIDLDPPSSAITALPAVTPETKLTVNWSGSDARSGVRWYHVQVRDTSRPDSQWEDWLVNTTKTTEMFQAQPGHTYAFRVRAMDNIGNWEDWPAGDDGDTYTLVDPSAAPPTAWWDAGYAHKRNLIVLNHDSDAMPVHFPMHLHFDGTTNPTAADIYNASLVATKGDDVRIVYDNQTEIDRFVQRFTASQIDVWFPLQAAIGGGATDNSSYQIYYGNAAASSPPANVNAVFLPEADANTMGLWHFQEGNGSTVNDASGRSHNGSFTSPGWADGYLGYTGRFNGTDAYVNMGDHADFDLTAMTLEAWVYVTSVNYGHIISKWGTGGNSYFIRMTGDRKVQFQISGDGGNRDVTSGDALELNRWYHVAGVHDGGNNMWIYVNGVQKGHNGDSRTPFTTGSTFRIGRDPNWDGSAFPGDIQHVRVSNVARSNFPYARVDVEPSVEAGALIAPPVTGSADLAVQSLTTYLNPGGGLLVQAVVWNQGERATQNNFFTDLYADHLPTGAEDYTGSIQFWINSPIEAGATVTLTTLITELAGLGGMAAQSMASLAPGSEVTGTLYSQVDSTGVVSETDNANNITSSGLEVCLASPDAYDEAGDDTYDTAPLIAMGETQSHNVDGPADRDWVKFEAQGGVTYTLGTFDLDSGADTYLYLYDTDGTTLLAANDDYGGTLASQIDWRAPATGIYYLLVQHWNPNVGGCGTSYSLSFQVQKHLNYVYLPLVVRDFTPPPPGFSLSPSPGQATVTQGQSSDYTINVGSLSGFHSPVTLSVSGLPENASATWSANPVTPPGSSVLTTHTGFGTPTGSYPLQVTGRNGEIEQTASVVLQVQAGQPVTDGAVLYEHANYGGNYRVFTDSDANLADDGFNDVASSLQIVGNYEVTLYAYTGYAGTSSTFTESDPDLSNDAIGDNQASSIQIERQLFTAVPAFGTGNTWDVAWGDYDGDGDLDLAVANDDDEQNYLYTNQGGGGAFVQAAQFGTKRTWSLAWGDYDNDDDLDMAVGNGYGSAQNYLYVNGGGGAFTSTTQFNSSSTEELAWGDYDNDGDLDLAVGNEWAQQNYLYVNNGDGTFIQSSQFGISDTHAVAWGDYDKDDDLDLAVGNTDQNYLFVNNGDGTFGQVEAFGTGETRTLAWADYDGDGDLDLAAGNTTQNFLYTNNGAGTFAESAQFGGGVTYSVAWGDYDNDGDPDLAVGNRWSEQNMLYRNNGDGTFTAIAKFGAGDTRSVAWGDYDDDGDLDLAVGNGSSRQNYLYVNQLN